MTNRIKKSLAKTYGKWTVLKHCGYKALCRCECGTERPVNAHDLRAGKSTNCGCIRRITLPASAKKTNKTHGRTNSTEYRTWVDMRRRCHQPKRPDYHRYGGRGIVVCDRWLNSFESFFADMGPRPQGKTLDRRDNNGPYSPDNCFWATKREQTINTRSVRMVTVEGQQMTAAEASRRISGDKHLVSNRLKRGWDESDAVSIPPLAHRYGLAEHKRNK